MICKKCEIEKEEFEFYKNDKTCKECRKESVRQNRKNKIDYYKDYDKKRYKNDPRVKERIKRYSKTERGKASASRANKKWIEKNKTKRAVHVLTGNAIRDGRLIKEPCSVCGCEKSQAHHPDYAKPFDVMWLCAKHHTEWHAKNGEGKNA